MSNAPSVEEADEQIAGLIECFYTAIADNDNETAHIYEDRIKTATLKAIADGVEDAQDLATLVLEITERETFDRWYA